MKNVARIVETGSWVPHHAWYPALSHIPLAALLRATQWFHRTTGLESLRVQHETAGWMLPIAYYLGRWLSVLYASLTALLTYAVARTSFARGTATLAVFLLIAAPMFSWSAAIFKPDLLAVLWTLVAFLLALGAGEKPVVGRYILAGVAIGLAASAKQIGAFAALPLVFATIWVGPRIRAWLGLAAAAATSALVFLSFHPSLHLVRLYLSMTERYDGWAMHQPEAPIPAALYMPFLAVTDTWHGPVIGIASILGMVGLTFALFKSRGRESSDLPKFLILTFVVSFPIGYTIVSSHPKDNIFLSTSLLPPSPRLGSSIW